MQKKTSGGFATIRSTFSSIKAVLRVDWNMLLRIGGEPAFQTLYARSASAPTRLRRYVAARLSEALGCEASEIQRGWNMMIPMPAKATAAPARSHGVGHTPSTPQSHTRATPI